MRCPFCSVDDTKVLETRPIDDNKIIKRRRECNNCNARFSTKEIAELEIPRIIKSNGERQEFSESKLKQGFVKALEKRPVASENINTAITAIKYHLATSKEDEILSSYLGNLVMEELKKLDEVAYIRFASVYRKFKDIEEFKDEIEKLIK